MIGVPPIFELCAADSGVQALLNDSSSGLRIYPFGQVPQDNPPEPRPYAVWRRIYGTPENTLSCPPDMDYVGIEVVCVGDPDTCREAHDAIILAIQSECHVVGLDDEGRDPDTDDYWVSFTADWFVPRSATTT